MMFDRLRLHAIMPFHYADAAAAMPLTLRHDFATPLPVDITPRFRYLR